MPKNDDEKAVATEEVLGLVPLLFENLDKLDRLVAERAVVEGRVAIIRAKIDELLEKT